MTNEKNNYKILDTILTNKRDDFYQVDEDSYYDCIKIMKLIRFNARPRHRWSNEDRDFEIMEDLKKTEEGFPYSEFREAEPTETADWAVEISFLNERFDDESPDNNGENYREDGTLIDWNEYMNDVKRGAYAAVIDAPDDNTYYFVSKKMYKFMNKNQNIDQIINEI
jgi:hypothetical protein